VSPQYQTAVLNVSAVGDVIGFPALASTSMEQGRVAMVHVFDLKYKNELATILPYGIYTIPECLAVGESEESLQAQGPRMLSEGFAIIRTLAVRLLGIPTGS